MAAAVGRAALPFVIVYHASRIIFSGVKGGTIADQRLNGAAGLSGA